MTKKTKITVAEKEFVDNYKSWFEHLQKHIDDEIIIVDDNGNKFVAMSEGRFHDIYDAYENSLPDEKTLTYEDFCDPTE